jgi:hypothetical protein
MENLKWIARTDGITIDVIEEKTGFGIVHIGTDAELRDADYPKDRAIANAHLIAAAPDLLEALQNISRACDGNNPEHEVFYFTTIAAINKALGINHQTD